MWNSSRLEPDLSKWETSEKLRNWNAWYVHDQAQNCHSLAQSVEVTNRPDIQQFLAGKGDRFHWTDKKKWIESPSTWPQLVNRARETIPLIDWGWKTRSETFSPSESLGEREFSGKSNKSGEIKKIAWLHLWLNYSSLLDVGDWASFSWCLKGWQLDTFSPYAIVYCYLEFKLSYLKNLKLFSIRVKELSEPIVLWRKGDGF